MKIDNYFDLLGIPRSMEVDLAQLNQNYFKLQQQYHPDKNKEEAAKSALVNLAYKKLKNKHSRLEYLVESAGKAELKPSPALLMEVMELRENPPEDAVKQAEADIEKLFKQASCEVMEENYDALAESYMRIKYLKKFIDDATNI